MISSSMSKSMCQYGGLFIQYKTMEDLIESWLSICSNIQNPVSLAIPNSKTIIEIYIAFITFSPYSSGSVQINYEKKDCPGNQYDFSSCKNDGFSQPKLHLFMTMQTCTDIWIQNNLNNNERTEGKCVLWQDHTILLNHSLTGPYDISIHNQDFPVAQFPKKYTLK